MSEPMSPRRPLPKAVYWRRRALVLIVAVAIVSIIAIVAWPRGGSDAASGGTPPGTGETPASTTTPGALAECDPAKLKLTAETDAAEYASGVLPRLWFTITSNATEQCTIDAGTDVQVFTISSPSGEGDEVYWRSTDCQTAPTPHKQILKPGVPVATEPITWDRTRSSPETCDATDEPQVGGGGASFDLVVQLGDLASEKKRFYLY